MSWSLALADASELSPRERWIQRCPDTRNCVSSRDRDESRYVRPLSFDGPADQAWTTLRKALLEEPRTAVVWEGSTALRAESTSLIFRFVDDLEFHMMPDEHIIDVRSASRVGYWDLGANRRRIERIRERFNVLQAGH